MNLIQTIPSDSILKHLNKLLKLSGEPSIYSITSMNLDLWLTILFTLFIKRTSSITINKLELFQQTILKLQEKNKAHFDTLDISLILSNDEATLKSFCHSLIAILKEKMMYKLKPNDSRRVYEALESLQEVVESLGLDYEFDNFNQVEVTVWMSIITSLFNIPDKEKMILLAERNPFLAMKIILQLLENKILKKQLTYISASAIIKHDKFTCTLFTEIIITLSKIVILQPFKKIRQFNYNNQLSPQLLSESNLDISVEPSVILETNREDSNDSVVPRISFQEQQNSLRTLRQYQLELKDKEMMLKNSEEEIDVDYKQIPQELQIKLEDDIIAKKLKEKKIEQFLQD
ncbi:hypothetical protein K502DRAFT_331928 [Neoconidiobolus thromboides FSU 785]|nr:hypothetical protein K502DRAFT_331928 [Neoconidiobolus thromboides FSU 785]